MVKRSIAAMLFLCAACCICVIIVGAVSSRAVDTVYIDGTPRELMLRTRSALENAQTSASDTQHETININTASAEELDQFLPGIGETKAAAIVSYREAVGGFNSVEELGEVTGIGEATLSDIRSLCRVSD